MKVDLQKQEKNRMSLVLEIPCDHAQQEYNKACRRLGQRVNIPGFRRGKAPLRMIERAVGQDRIKQEALDRILPHAFADVISEHQLDIISPPQIEHFTFDLGKPVTVKANMELRPEVTLPALELTLEVPEFKAPEEQFQKELDDLVTRHTKLEAVETARPALATDVLTIDFTGYIDGAAIAGGAAKAYPLDLKESPFIEGFAEQLIGKSAGEALKVSVTFPEDYHEATLAGKLAEFDVTIISIQERLVPDLNDEFAKQVGAYDNLDALKEAVTKAIQAGVDQENDARKRKAVVQEAVRLAQVDLPDSLVQRETMLLLEEVQQRFRSQDLSWEEFIESQGLEAIKANLRQEAEGRIKTSFTLGAIARQEQLSVSDNEFNEQVAILAAQRRVEDKVVLRQLANNPSALQALTDQLLAQKVIDLLVARSSFTLVDEEAYISRLADAIDTPIASLETAATTEKIDSLPEVPEATTPDKGDVLESENVSAS
jgi:trigger factor